MVSIVVRDEDIEWFYVDDVRGAIQMPELIDAKWLENPRVLVRRKETKPEGISHWGIHAV